MTDKQFKYLVKLIVVMGCVSVALSFLMTTIAFERNLARMHDTAKTLMEWSKKADLANEMLNDMYKVERTKEIYESQGIGATEENINQKQRGK